jgi:hypothetical protein
MRLAVLLTILLLLAVLPMARCDETLPLNVQLTLDASNPTKSYFITLTSGTTVSMSVSVTGDAVNFIIFNSTDGQLLNKYGVTSVDEQWTAPYDGRFEFHIETVGTQSTATISLSSSGGGQGQTGNTTLQDQQFTISAESMDYNDYTDFYANLTSGDSVSISVSVDGSPIRFAIFNGTDFLIPLLDRQNVSSVNEEWTAPSNGYFDFYFKIHSGTAQIHFTLQKLAAGQGGGGGFDPTLVVVAVVVVVVVLLVLLLIVRLKKQPSLTPPPPEVAPPPPPPP